MKCSKNKSKGLVCSKNIYAAPWNNNNIFQTKCCSPSVSPDWASVKGYCPNLSLFGDKKAPAIQ